MSVPCPVCGSATTDGTVCLHCGSISAAPPVVAVPMSVVPPLGGVPPVAAPLAAAPVAPFGAVPVSAAPASVAPASVAPVGAVPVGGVPVVGAALPPDGQAAAYYFPSPAAEQVVLPAAGGVGAAAVPVASVPVASVPSVAVPAVGPSVEPMAVAVLPPPERAAVVRAVALGIAAAVVLALAWVAGYSWFDRNQEAGRPVIAAAQTPGITPSDPAASTDAFVPTDPSVPTDPLVPTDPVFPVDPTAPLTDDQIVPPPDGSLPSTPPTIPINPVPVAGQATCEAPPGVDAAGAPQTYEVSRAFDGALDTAWRCVGDASGQSVTVDLGQPVQLTSVGLVPGYDKIDPVDGADRFAQGRTVTRARWVFDDGSAVEVAPNGARGMQTTPVQVTTQTVRLEILETRPGATITDNAGVQWAAVDATAVSELAFAGLTY